MVASVSTEIVLLVLSYTFRRTGMPASGEYTRTVIVVSVAVNGKGLSKPETSATVVPPQTWAPSGLLLLATVFALVLLTQWLTVLVLLAHPPYLIDLGYQWLATMALYPMLALVFRWLFRIGWRKIPVTRP